MKTIKALIVTVGLVFLSATHAAAAPVSLSLTIDQPTTGRAVLSGSINDLRFANPGVTSFNFIQTGTHWQIQATLFEVSTGLSAPPLKDFSISFRASHLSAPHGGEATPGLTLRSSHGHILGINPGLNTIGPQDSFDSLLHPGSSENHKDYLHSHLDNLNNGNGIGFLTNNLQMSARIDLAHGVPEPASLALLGSGLLGMIGLRRKNRS